MMHKPEKGLLGGEAELQAPPFVVLRVGRVGDDNIKLRGLFCSPRGVAVLIGIVHVLKPQGG
jgi:hypothetical protein